MGINNDCNIMASMHWSSCQEMTDVIQSACLRTDNDNIDKVGTALGKTVKIS